MKKLYTEKQAAALLEVSVKTLQGWRYKGGGPRFIKMGRLIRYAESDLEAFVLEKRRTSTSDSGQQPPYKLPKCFTPVPTQNPSWPDLPPRPSVVARPRPTPGTVPRSPTPRRHRILLERVRIRLRLPNQRVTESTWRRAR